MRVGFYGGSFDPVHNGHLAVAEAARTKLELDEVWLVPTGHPSHRDEPYASYEDRFEMVRLAVDGKLSLLASDVESPQSAPKHYTIETIRRLRQSRPADEWFVILGMDSFNNLHTWREPQALASEAELIVVSRPGLQPDAKLRLPASRVHFIPAVQVDVSASQIRRRVVEGQRIAGLVPARVEEYIHAHHLYEQARISQPGI
jgi:nicotinate-nucleotide adenylyltransferase